MLFIAVAAVALTGSPAAAVRVFAIVALITAALLGLISWGLVHSVRIDAADAAGSRLDAAIEQALADSGGMSCGCGHDHDMSEMHVRGGSAAGEAAYGAPVCAHDGSGDDCAHNCDTCALAALRPSPKRPRAERLTH